MFIIVEVDGFVCSRRLASYNKTSINVKGTGKDRIMNGIYFYK